MEQTILIAEDQIEFLGILSHYLKCNGYQVLTAGDGEAAVRITRDHSPDLILMDGALPRLDGVEAIRCLKQDPATRDIPVVMLTAMSYGAVGRRAREAGCDGFLSKPVKPQRVLEEIRMRLGGDSDRGVGQAAPSVPYIR